MDPSLIVAALFVVIVVAYYWNRSQCDVPGPGLLWFLLNKKRIHQAIPELYAKYGRLARVQLGPKTLVYVMHPETAKQVLKDEEDFQKSPVILPNEKAKSLFGENVVLANGEQWKTQRHVMNPAFHHSVIKSFIPIFITKAQRMLDLWSRQPTDTIEARQWLRNMTVDILSQCVFGIDFGTLEGKEHEYLTALSTMFELSNNMWRRMFSAYQYLPLKSNRDLVLCLDKLGEFVEKIIQQKKEQRQQRQNLNNETKEEEEEDLLSRLVFSDLSIEEIKSNVFIFFVAGHETTATALTWALYWLSRNPEEIQDRARKEVDEVLHGQLPNEENLPKMKYLDNVIKEGEALHIIELSNRVATVLRISPPVGHIVNKIATKDVILEGRKIPKGTQIGISMLTIQHLEEFHPEPERFNPDRFLEKQRHPFCYLPFSLGSRIWYQSRTSFSVTEKVFLALLLQRFSTSLPSANISLDSNIALYAPQELKVTLKPRPDFPTA